MDQRGTPRTHVRAIRGAGSLKLGAVVGSDGVDDEEANVVAGEKHGDLILEDVVLGFQVRGYGAEDVVERWAEGGINLLDGRVGGEDLGETAGGEAGLGGNVEGLLGEAVRRRKLDGEAEREEELGLSGAGFACDFGDGGGWNAAGEGDVEEGI